MPAKASPYEKRRQNSATRLRQALDRLIDGHPTHAAHQRGYRLTVAALARESGIGRNAIYTNHRELLDALIAAAAIPSSAAAKQDQLAELQTTIAAMKQAERQQITENGQLLARARAAEAEADRLRRHNARLIAERDTALRAVSLVPWQTEDSPS
ncbi:hypothetical protein [Novosphingobium lindaniclasticum]